MSRHTSFKMMEYTGKKAFCLSSFFFSLPFWLQCIVLYASSGTLVSYAFRAFRFWLYCTLGRNGAQLNQVGYNLSLQLAKWRPGERSRLLLLTL